MMILAIGICAFVFWREIHLNPIAALSEVPRFSEKNPGIASTGDSFHQRHSNKNAPVSKVCSCVLTIDSQN